MQFSLYIPIFRGRSKSGKWHYGFYLGNATDHDYGFLNTKTGSHLAVELKTISMSTGLKDANGQMIYDGDILDFRSDKVLVYWNSEAFQWDTVLLVENELERAVWRSRETCELGWVAAEIPILGQMTTKIIGNRWDNPELLYEGFEEEKNPTTIPF